ncbi:DNA modification methylase [Thiothrix eikelboomii]|uniref:Methyltransferase n=1 Tax=Thiothrix eikelboomii TaxID=92487 RepID=A0A1T4W582_9GAMM|nr:DNA modification methylase [Thiothrix eikelboomii]SKA72309.1 DNA modification methylase [Thiothrix eikelboomii]
MDFVPIDLLDDYQKNARNHPEEQISAITRIMAGDEKTEGLGWTMPALVELVGGRYQMIAGHGRKEVATRLYAQGKHLKMSDGQSIPFGSIPVVFAKGWTEDQKRAYILADNQLPQMAAWNEDLLAEELSALEQHGFDLSLLGFSDDDLSRLLLEDSPSFLTHEDECPDLHNDQAITKVGDIWQLGEHYLICGSSTEPATVLALLVATGVSKADMIFTDPPYLMNFRGSLKGDGSTSANGRHAPITNDKLGKAEGEAFLLAVATNVKRFCAGSWYICFYRLGVDWLFDAIKAAGLKWRNLIIWQKGHLTLSNSDYKSTYEPIIYGWVDDYLPIVYGWNEEHRFYGEKGAVDNWQLDSGLQSIWEITRTHINDLHPTMKPVALCERAILNSSKRGQVVLDLFGGSGSTLIAAEKNGRKAALVELEPAYCDVIIKRWEDYTGKKASLYLAPNYHVGVA